MNLFRIYLVILTVGLGAYTLMVGMHHGWNLVPLFFAALAEGTWQGQFNADFSCLLTLSALWVAWRHQFSAGGLALGLVALFAGTMFLAPYLLWASTQCDGNTDEVLLGRDRARRRA